MYLPLTGFREKKKSVDTMSVDSVGSSLASRIVQPSAASAQAQEEAEKVSPQPPEPFVPSRHDEVADDSNHGENVFCSDAMSTQDFLLLRTQASEDPYELLDKVIARIKENMKELGDTLETIAEMSESTSKSKLALQLLEKTFEAIDEMRGDK